MKSNQRDKSQMSKREYDLYRQGDDHFQAGQYDKAEECFQEALQLVRKQGLREREFIWLVNIALTHFWRGEWQHSIEYYESALEIPPRFWNDVQEFDLYSKLSRGYNSLGLHKKAFTLLETGIERARKKKNKREEADLIGQLGTISASTGASEKSLRYYEQALALSRKIKDTQLIEIQLGNMGYTYLQQREYAKAVESYSEAIELSGKIGDEVNKKIWINGLKAAKAGLKEWDEKRKSRAVDFSTRPGPIMLNALTTRVSLLKDIGDKRELILSESNAISSAIQSSIEEDEPHDTFALIDDVKSIIGRELLSRRRVEFIKMIPDDVTMLHGLYPYQVGEAFVREPDLCAIHFYYTDDYSFYAYMAYSSEGKPTVEKITISRQLAGYNLYQLIVSYLETLKNNPFEDTTDLLFGILGNFGESILPRLSRLKGIKRALLIPYKILYTLPLHAMYHYTSGKETVVLIDELVTTTYASSLIMHLMRHKIINYRKQPMKYLLSYYDPHLSHIADLERQYFEFVFEGFEGVDILKRPEDVPKDLSHYWCLHWSSHAHSDPAGWDKSYLKYGTEKYYTKDIIRSWSLDNADFAVLSSCETGIDKSLEKDLDEYFGLDVAVHIAGAKTVISTMWPVEESAAVLMTLLLLPDILTTEASPSQAARNLRRLLLYGYWKDLVKSKYEELQSSVSIDAQTRKVCLELFDRLIALDEYTLAQIQNWAVYRSFGGW